jgi:hypothetical protein
MMHGIVSLAIEKASDQPSNCAVSQRIFSNTSDFLLQCASVSTSVKKDVTITWDS